MNKNLLSIVALGLVAVFFGSMVYADTSAVGIVSQTSLGVKVPSALPNMKDIKTPAPVLVKATDATAIKTTVKPITPDKLEVLSRSEVSSKLATEKSEKPDTFGKFVSAAAKVKAAIVKDKKEGNGDATFHGWSIQRIVNASGLSAEAKASLLANIKASRAEDKDWSRHTFLMWNADKSYASIGKMSVLQEGDSMTFYARGFSSTDDHRFYFFGSNGTMAGVQNGKVFWGTYSNGNGNLTFTDGTTMSVQYLLYG